MTPKGERRRLIWEKGKHKPLKPLTNCIRADLPNTLWLAGGDVEQRVINALRQIDKGFEIIYDRFTADHLGPGHHLYRVLSHGATPGQDRMVLEFSLQNAPFREWPNGKPKAPGMWVVNLVKERDKSRWTESELEERSEQRLNAAQAEIDKKDAEFDRQWKEEIVPTIQKAQSGELLNTRRGRRETEKALGRLRPVRSFNKVQPK